MFVKWLDAEIFPVKHFDILLSLSPSFLPSLPPIFPHFFPPSLCPSVRRAWHDDIMTWWHDDMMTWWHDDMMTWWHDDMMTCEIFVPLQAHVPPLKFVIFGRIAPLSFSEKHDDMMTWCLPPPQRVRRAHPIFRNFSKVPETFSTANTTITRALQGAPRGRY